ncbi:MAG: HD domain-containing protein [Lactobacillus sp.]|jgi:uncharacterized protein|nr:HD domain-containing protein [Lactobacillus sp.]
MMIDKMKDRVKELLGDNFDHGYGHVERVFDIANDLCDTIKEADREIVNLAVLLHDVDDYKLFGQECADNLTNAKSIMNDAGVSEEKQAVVCDIIKNMGYSKCMAGIRPSTVEGKIVSDADMLDTCGVIGSLRAFGFRVRSNLLIFDKNSFPESGLTADQYKKIGREKDSFVNHHFDKLLKLKKLMFTEEGKKEAERRNGDMIHFLKAFLREINALEWIEYLDGFIEKNK